MAHAAHVFREGETIINMIGHTGSDPDMLHDVNVQFVSDLLTRAADAGVAHVVLASTAAVYGAATADALTEDMALAPVSAYGTSKAAMEDLAHTHSDRPAITILRISNIAGADALTVFARKNIAAGLAMDLHRLPDGTTPLRSYIGPQDLFRTVRYMAEPHTDGVRTLNVAHPQPVTLEGVLRGYKSHVMPALTWTDKPAPSGTLPKVVLSTRRLETYVTFDQHPDPADAFAAQVAESPLQ